MLGDGNTANKTQTTHKRYQRCPNVFFRYMNKWEPFISTLTQFFIQQIVCELVPFLNRQDVRSHSSKQAEVEYKKKNCPKDTKPSRHSYKKNCHKTWKMQMVTKSSFYEQIKTTWSTCNIETTLITITRYFQNLLVLLLDILRTLHGMLLRHAFPCCLLLSSSSSTSSSSSGQNAFFNRPRKPLSSSQAVLVPWKNWRAKRWS